MSLLIFFSKIISKKLILFLDNNKLKILLQLQKLFLLEKKKNDKLNQNKIINIQKCINWCIQNNIPYNKYSQPSNIFLS